MKLLFIILIIYSNLFADFYDDQIRYIEQLDNKQTLKNGFSQKELDQFQNKQPFQIISGQIKLNPLGGFADGTYKLVNTNTTQISSNSYHIDLNFKLKKKKYISYKHKEALDILYDTTNSKQIWIKYHNKIYKYNVPKLYYVQMQQKNRLIKTTKRDNLKVTIKNMKLLFKF